MRALYEGSAVPVREIARLAGVSERTLYKYVAKQAGRSATPGHPRAPARPRRGNRRAHALRRKLRRHVPSRRSKARAGASSAATTGPPFAAGLKASDPAQAARAPLPVLQADALAREAQRRRMRSGARASATRPSAIVNRTLDQINDYRDECRKKQQVADSRRRCDAVGADCQLAAAADRLDIVTRQDQEGGG